MRNCFKGRTIVNGDNEGEEKVPVKPEVRSNLPVLLLLSYFHRLIPYWIYILSVYIIYNFTMFHSPSRACSRPADGVN